MQISHLDHLVLTVSDIDKAITFYVGLLGMEEIHFSNQRIALRFGNQKINLHQADTPTSPKAKRPTIGSADLCLIVDTPLETVMQELAEKNISLVEGVVERTGATGKLRSLYIYDPDGNLVELANVV